MTSNDVYKRRDHSLAICMPSFPRASFVAASSALHLAQPLPSTFTLAPPVLALSAFAMTHADRERNRITNMLVEDYLLEWLEQHKPNISSSTYLNYKRMINGRMTAFFKPMRLKVKEITGDEINAYYTKIRADGLKGTTAQRHHAMGDEYLSVEHLMIGVFANETPAIKRIFADHGITKNAFTGELSKVRTGPVTSDNPETTYDALAKYGTDLVQRARDNKLDPVIGRDTEIRNVIRILSRKTKNNPVLIGEPGVGKTAIAEGLAQRIVRGDVPEGLKEKTIFSLDMVSASSALTTHTLAFS